MSFKYNPFTSNLDISGTSGGGGGGGMVVGDTVTGGVPNAILTVDSGGDLTQLGPLTNGQLLIGRTGNSALATTLTGTTNQISITNASGSITLSTPQDIATSSSPTFANLTLSNGSLVINQAGATYTETTYINPTSLLANASTLGLTYTASSVEGCIIHYSMKQATSNAIRTGILYIANNTTVVSLSDNYTETANVEIMPSVVISGGNVEISFLNTNLTNLTTFKAEIKKFRI